MLCPLWCNRKSRSRRISCRSTGPITLSFTLAMHASPPTFTGWLLAMKLVAYAGPETGVRDRASYVLEQGKVRFVLTTPLRPDGEIAEHVRVHGDGVRDVALWVDDARQAWKETTKRGARSVREPFELKDEQGTVRISSIAAYGDTIHSFVERSEYNGRVSAGLSRRAGRPAGAARGPDPCRPHGGQRGLERDESLGGFLRARHGLLALPALRRQGHFDGVLGADVEGDGQRQRPREVPHQRAGRGTEEVADRGVSGVLPRARACSISRWRPTTFWRRWRSCRSRVWSS